VAANLQDLVQQALDNPKQTDGQMINSLESLHHPISSPLMAHRFREWSERRIGWRALQQLERDPELVSIVVPVYGDPAELDECLISVQQATGIWAWELIAVMNDAAPDSGSVLERHTQKDRRIRAVWPGENVQFALGCNLGFAASKGERVVFLNNDCRVQTGWLDALMAPLADPSVGAVQPRLLKPDGTVQCLGVVFRDGQVLGYPLYAGLDGGLPCCNKEHQLQAITGSCLGLNAIDFAMVRGLNACYLNSQEDVDLCKRLLDLAGRERCVSTPATTVVHSESRAPGRFRHTRWSRHLFVRKHQNRIKADDLEIYRCDGIELTGWLEDSSDYCREGIGAGRAILTYGVC
jgi:GT2 family glycosyltransferase